MRPLLETRLRFIGLAAEGKQISLRFGHQIDYWCVLSEVDGNLLTSNEPGNCANLMLDPWSQPQIGANLVPPLFRLSLRQPQIGPLQPPASHVGHIQTCGPSVVRPSLVKV